MIGEIEIRTANFTQVPISNNTFRKIKAYSKISGHNECYGFLLSPLSVNNGIVYNAILAPDQKVGEMSAKIDGRAAGKAKAEIKNMGYKAVGFWHSHGGGTPFHSSIDNGNMDKLMLAFVGNTEEKYRTKPQEGYDLQGNDVFFRRKGLELKVSVNNGEHDLCIKQIKNDYFPVLKEDGSQPLLIVTKNLSVIINDETRMLMTRNPCNIKIGECLGESLGNIGVAYSIVVNNKGEYFAEIAVSKWCNTCEKPDTKINKAGLNIIEADDDIRFEREELLAEFKEKVKGFRRFSFF